MRGLNTKLQTMMTTCTNVTYHEAVNIAIALEAKYRQHKELKKKEYTVWIFWGKSKEVEGDLSSSKS
jgi:aconitase A